MATAAWTAKAVRASASPRVNGSPSSRSYRLSTPRTRPWASRGTLTWLVAAGSGPPLPAGLARIMARPVAATVPATPWPTGIRSAGSRWARPKVASRTRCVRSGEQQQAARPGPPGLDGRLQHHRQQLGQVVGRGQGLAEPVHGAGQLTELAAGAEDRGREVEVPDLAAGAGP